MNNVRGWTPITKIENVPLREGRAVTVGDSEIAIFHLEDRYLTIENKCPHKGGPLVRRHRFRHHRGVPAARAALRSGDRHARAGIPARLRGDVSDARRRRRHFRRSRRRPQGQEEAAA